MQVLGVVDPSPEQLTIIRDYRPGETVIRGAGGSGKTTTALMRLSFLSEFFRTRRARQALQDPVRVLVLSFNKTLKGYISELAEKQVRQGDDVMIKIETFDKWAYDNSDHYQVDEKACQQKLRSLGGHLRLESEFLLQELSYLMGRFLPKDLDSYVTCRREHRGLSPRVEAPLRRKILEEVVAPYRQWKVDRKLSDLNDMAVDMALNRRVAPYDVVIVDEAQDFSANRVRAVLNHLASDHSATFVLDAVQRIYPHHFQWREVGVDIRRAQTFRLRVSFRNTTSIARLALPLLEGLDPDEDATVPDPSACKHKGTKPDLVEGTFSRQIDYCISRIGRMDLSRESVGILHTKGWFDYVEKRLDQAAIQYDVLTGRRSWPQGEGNVALSTLHSAKGLEFDHVFIVGLNAAVTPHGSDPRDSTLDGLRRLVAMGIGRAKRTVAITYKADEASDLIGFFDPSTYQAIRL